jgi:hypothetical protein
MMAAGRLQDNTTTDDASEAILQLRKILGDFLAQAMNWNFSLEIDLDRSFHCPPPIQRFLHNK